MLLVDRILELEVGRRVVAEWRPLVEAGWFQGHFPGEPILPGVLLIEALAQAAAVAVMSDPANRDKLPLLAGIDEARFRRPVRPGETVRLEATLLRAGARAGRGRVVARVGQQVAAEARLMFLLTPRGRGSTAPRDA